MKSRILTCIAAMMLLGAPLQLAAANPVPMINLPLVPDALAPGAAGFKLTVNGTGFVSGSVVKWHGIALATTFVSSSQLTADIPASAVATAHTASVTVVSPNPGGGTSNVAFFNVVRPVASIYLSTPTTFATGLNPTSVATADFNGDGKLDLAAANNGSSTVSVLLGNGDGTFQPHVDYPTGVNPVTVAVGDFNGDGKLDLAISNSSGNTVSILLGNGDGTFQSRVDFGTGVGPGIVGVGDFNTDGHLDLAVACSDGVSVYTVSVLLGNGDGTFQPHADYATGAWPSGLAIGDFNADGKLDMAAGNAHSNTVSVLLGNGDGTFQPKVDYPTANNPRLVVTGDFNGDGKLDLAVATQFSNSVSVLLGNGDGTFQPYAQYGTGADPVWLALGDLNGDSKLDLAVANYNDSTVNVLLGNGDGTFQAKTDYAPGLNPNAVAVGDFTGKGRPGLAVANVADNTLAILLPAVSLFKTRLTFGSKLVGVSSAPQTVTLTNIGASSLTISSIAPTGHNAADFSQTNTCGTSVLAGSSCTISVIFTPTQVGPRIASVTITDSAGSPQSVVLSGTGLSPVQLSSTSLNFGNQVTGTSSAAQTVTVTNIGAQPVSISGIAPTGKNASDFSETNTCPTSLPAGANCTISVTFTPAQLGPRTASVSITDNAAGGPESIALTGTGVTSGPNVTLSTNSLTFGLQLLRTTTAQPITLSNYGDTALNIIGITPSGDYAESNNCGSSLAAGASCTISVAFTPSARGPRTGTLSLTDNATGSPQSVSLTGTGTVVNLYPPSLGFYGPSCPNSVCSSTVTLTNVGPGALSITYITHGYFPISLFEVRNNCGSSVAAGMSCTLTVSYQYPKGCSFGGGFFFNVVIKDDGGGSPQKVPVSVECP